MVAASSTFNTYFAEVLSLLWPEASATNSELQRATDELSLIALPNARRPRLILPSRPKKVAARAIRNYKASATGRQLVVTRTLAAMARLGVLGVLPNRLTVTSSRQSIDRRISTLLGTHVHIAVYIGPDRAVQKPILQVIDTNGNTLAFAKLSTRALTRALIRHEAESLTLLQSLGLREFGTPRVLAHTTWHDSELLIQSAIQPGDSAVRLRKKLPGATTELMGCLGITEQPWLSGEYRQSLVERLMHLEHNYHAPQLQRLLVGLDARLARGPIRLGAWHGDWGPWNMTTTSDQLIAWDWEHFQSGVALGLDAAHFDLSELTTAHGRPMTEAFQLLVRGEFPGLVAELKELPARDVLFSLYLLEISLRYLEAGEDRIAGTKMSQMSTWLADVVDLCLFALQNQG